MPLEDIVQAMRADVKVEPVGRESFRVSFVSGEAKTAQKVTERLAALVIDENTRDRAKFSDTTNQFLQSQLEEARRRLSESRRRSSRPIARSYAGQLPTELHGEPAGDAERPVAASADQPGRSIARASDGC